MAKRCMVNREIKRAKLVKKYAAKRAELKKQMLDMSLSSEQREAAAKSFTRCHVMLVQRVSETVVN